MSDEFTKEEIQALEKMKKVCAGSGPKSRRTVLDCALLKQRLILENNQKLADLQNAVSQLNNVVNHVKNVAAINLLRLKLESVAFVTGRMNALQNEGILLIGALQRASADYDQILAARASQPIAREILLGIALAVLPELKVLGRTYAFFVAPAGRNRPSKIATLAKSVFGNSATPWTRDPWRSQQILAGLSPHAQEASEGLRSVTRAFMDGLDNASKDLIEAIKDPLASSAEIDAETQRRFTAHNAKNQIVTAVLKQVERTLVAVTLLEPLFHRFIFWHDGGDTLAILQTAFDAVGFLHDPPYNARTFDWLADLILYDMLRAFVKQYVSFRTPAGNRETGPLQVRDLPDYLPESSVTGIDGAQRQLIYDRFKRVSWSDRSRPPVNNYKDLIDHWGARRIKVERLRGGLMREWEDH